jgi:hypothetical protein
MSYAGQVEVGSGVTSPVASTLYGICNTAAATAAKIVALPDYDELVVGTTAHVKFTNGNTAENATLEVGSTAAKPIYQYGTTAPGITSAASWAANSVVSFTYDGTAWRMNDAGANAAMIAYTDSKVSAEATAREASMVKKIAPAYSSAATYATGDLCIYNESLYRCTTAITVAEAWTPGHWAAVTATAATKPRIGSIYMPVGSWAGSNPWYMSVGVTGTSVFSNSIVSILPDYNTFNRMVADGTAAIYIANNNGSLTAYAILNRPNADIVVSCQVSEIA